MTAADCLLALRNGSDEQDPEAPLVGAMLVAQFFAVVRSALGVK